jgi:predicted nucleotidyltransferase
LFGQQYGVKRSGVFGSYARGEERGDSDLDILVIFEEGAKTFDNFMELKFFLEDLFVRKVDLVTINALRPQLREEILKEVAYA